MQEIRSRVGKITWSRKWQLVSVFLPRKIPQTEEPGGLQSMGLQSQAWLSTCQQQGQTLREELAGPHSESSSEIARFPNNPPISKWSEVKSLSRVQLFSTPWTVAHQAPPSMGFSRQEYWSGLPIPSPRDLPDPGIESRSPALQADALTSEPPGKPKSPLNLLLTNSN